MALFPYQSRPPRPLWASPRLCRRAHLSPTVQGVEGEEARTHLQVLPLTRGPRPGRLVGTGDRAPSSDPWTRCGVGLGGPFQGDLGDRGTEIDRRRSELDRGGYRPPPQGRRAGQRTVCTRLGRRLHRDRRLVSPPQGDRGRWYAWRGVPMSSRSYSILGWGSAPSVPQNVYHSNELRARVAGG